MGLQGRQSCEMALPRQSAEWGANNIQKALKHALLKCFIRNELKDLMFKTKNPESTEEVVQELECEHVWPVVLAGETVP